MEKSSKEAGSIEVVPAKQRRYRIPRLKPFSHYEGSLDGKRQHCKGCKKMLKKADHATCSEACRNKVQLELTALQKQLDKDKIKWLSAQVRNK